MERRFEYVIKVWKRSLERLKSNLVYDEIVRKNPGKKVSIVWRTKEKILVCK